MHTSEIAYPCAHDLGTANQDDTVSIYHPLSLADITYLLSQALSCRPDQAAKANSIAIRLGQGIPGLTCPHPPGGNVMKTLHHIQTLYFAWYEGERGEIAMVAQQLWALMQRGEESEVPHHA